MPGTKYVAGTNRVFDELGRVTNITHEPGAMPTLVVGMCWQAAFRSGSMTSSRVAPVLEPGRWSLKRLCGVAQLDLP